MKVSITEVATTMRTRLEPVGEFDVDDMQGSSFHSTAARTSYVESAERGPVRDTTLLAGRKGSSRSITTTDHGRFAASFAPAVIALLSTTTGMLPSSKPTYNTRLRSRPIDRKSV